MTDYTTMTDQELKDIRQSMPKYLNDMTLEQRTNCTMAYEEQKRRYDAKTAEIYEQYNREVEKAGYKIGDKVSYFARSMLGIGGMVVNGTVRKGKKYFVKLDVSFNGKKTAHLTTAWQKEVTP